MSNTFIVKNLLPFGTKLTISSIVKGSNIYDSMVNDIDDTAIFIARPSAGENWMDMTKGMPIVISSILPTGKLSFNSKIAGFINEPVYSVVVEMPSDVVIEQLRHFFRVSANLKIRIFPGPISKLKNVAKSWFDTVFEDAVLDNISGGGCKINTNADIKNGDIVVISFKNTPVTGAGYVECKVIRASKGMKWKHEASLIYMDIDENTRSNIIRYVFRREIELR
jgi:c-di-GMP-binding flagellar brake protein YcgR